MRFEVAFNLPYYAWTIAKHYEGDLEDVSYKNAMYTFQVEEADETAKRMKLIILWESENKFDVNKQTIGRVVEKAIEFANHVINQARTFDISIPDFVLVSPRSVKVVEVKISKADSVVYHELYELKSEMPESFEEFFGYLNEPGAYDTFAEAIRSGWTQILEINLLVDAFHAIEESRFSEAVINCLTAVEARVSSILTKWFTKQFFNKNESAIENMLIDIPTANKYELIFGTVAAKALKDEKKLLEDMKGHNKLRNDIIHKGRRADRKEALRCLESCSKLISILFFDYKKEEE